MMAAMSDDTDATATTEQDAATVAERLLTLQRTDTEIDQLRLRRDRLAEREQLAAASAALTAWEQQRQAMNDRLGELTSIIERAESDAADLVAHKQRLEAQLKTVIAPREAEALMHEIATLDEQRDGVETTELEALEEQAALDDSLTEHLRDEESLRSAASAADEALGRATSAIDTEVESLVVRRDGERDGVPAALLGRYDRVRGSAGVAVAQLVGRRCDGCHLDLSAAEVDDAKDQARAGDGIADCPNCGRMLVV